MRKILDFVLLALGITLAMTSCSTTRYVPEGEYLLNSVRVTDADRDEHHLAAPLKDYVRQKPNRRWFSLFRLPLATYSLAGRDTTRWVNRLLRSMGEPPVLYDSAKVRQSCGDLTLQLRNMGYLDAQVEAMSIRNGKRMDVEYVLRKHQPYFINRIDYDIMDSAVNATLAQEGTAGARIYPGMQFDVAQLDAERKRITNVLTNRGYYRFNKDYITYVADSLPGQHKINLRLRLSPVIDGDNQMHEHPRYVIRQINYGSGDPLDSMVYLRKRVMRECTHLNSGDYFSSQGLQRTYNHFGRLQAVKYTNITFQPVEGSDSLDCQIHLMHNKPSTLSFQPEGTNTAGDLGAAASVTYQNRNLFHGSEVFSLQLRGAYEAIKGLEGYANQDFVEYSAEAKLQFPRFIVPFVGHEVKRQMNATSEVSLLYDMQNRPEFHRRVVSVAWRYKWDFPQRHDRFQLDLLDLNYVFMPWISDTFRRDYLDNDNNRNAILSYNYKNLFITKIGFGYSYSKGRTAFKSNVETSGNVLSMMSRAFGAQKDDMGQYQLFNIAFAQYVKCDLDVSHSLVFDQNNQLVMHMGLGVAYPYGNSSVLPFEKRYFSGGANSVRGWNVRSLGPGKYKERDGRINFINQTGDMKLDLNAEFRTRLFWKFSSALFVDAGNIWTLRQYDEQAGGQFRVKDFMSQIAVGYGLGLRLNFDYFILRFDLGMKAINPAYEEEENEHYPILHPRFSRDYAFHFAVGLPF